MLILPFGTPTEIVKVYVPARFDLIEYYPILNASTSNPYELSAFFVIIWSVLLSDGFGNSTVIFYLIIVSLTIAMLLN